MAVKAQVNTDSTQTLTNKTLLAPVIATISNTGTLTLPSSTDTLVGRATTDTLTNKTLSNPTLTNPTLSSPTVSGGATFGSALMAVPSGTAPLYMCRAWVNFNGTGTVAIRASGNVASITDNGVGDYTVNFTTALASANYCAVTGSAQRTTTVVNTDYREHVAGSAQMTVSAIRLHSAATTGNGAFIDFEMMSVAIFL